MNHRATAATIAALTLTLTGCGPATVPKVPTASDGARLHTAISEGVAAASSAASSVADNLPTVPNPLTTTPTPTTAPAVPATPAGPSILGDGTQRTNWTAVDKAAALELIRSLPTKGENGVKYDRKQFGQAWDDAATDVAWSRNGCDTRNDILARDLDNVTKSGKCKVTAGDLHDGYEAPTAPVIHFVQGPNTSDEVQIDHMVPLSYAWSMGANTWTPAKRLSFANDPRNLTAVLGTLNTAKRDKGPASWLPPGKAMRCGYVEKFAAVSAAYGLPVKPADRDAMIQVCS